MTESTSVSRTRVDGIIKQVEPLGHGRLVGQLWLACGNVEAQEVLYSGEIGDFNSAAQLAFFGGFFVRKGHPSSGSIFLHFPEVLSGTAESVLRTVEWCSTLTERSV